MNVTRVPVREQVDATRRLLPGASRSSGDAAQLHVFGRLAANVLREVNKRLKDRRAGASPTGRRRARERGGVPKRGVYRVEVLDRTRAIMLAIYGVEFSRKQLRERVNKRLPPEADVS